MNNSIEWKEDQEGWQFYKKAKVLQHQSPVGGLWNLVNQPAAKAIQHVGCLVLLVAASATSASIHLDFPLFHFLSWKLNYIFSIWLSRFHGLNCRSFLNS